VVLFSFWVFSVTFSMSDKAKKVREGFQTWAWEPTKGFSLIELLIVVAIILIIAAISVPNLLRSRMAANEASAVGSIRTINTAVTEYSFTYGVGYPANLAQLGGAGTVFTCNGAGLIDSVLGAGIKSGYAIAIIPGIQPTPATSVPSGCTAGFSDGYVVTAVPVSVGTSGQRAFCSDASGVIRSNSTGTLSYTSPNCSATQTPLQ